MVKFACPKVHPEARGPKPIENTHKNQVGSQTPVLSLVVSQEPYNAYVAGVKKMEFRSDSRWMRSRLFHRGDRTMPRSYSYVEIRHGYSSNAPRLRFRFSGFAACRVPSTVRYSTGLVVEVEVGDWIIFMQELE
jgi:hypothetical protein